MNIKYLLVLVLMGCASGPDQKPMATKVEPPFVRVMATKTDIVYSYKIRGDGPTGFDLAELDAKRLCRSKWGLAAYQKTQVSCASYNNSATMCAVTFHCQ